ncbi:MAG: DUF2130 domain-containing protein [Limnospira sp. PMC 894.15]|uniref:DUF2130 domain-containing protein n=1 Tax=unclassified Limnospira TaxID=2642885 RepID=UPI00061AF6BB|nr:MULTISPECIES: DUF2130 domain-containing protein [unclassified Limnospira]MDT9188013.1 DUF2130 domain-containing protein [Limnospira sp. PMC 894.15]MDT9233859.1 DUF2130 domain-containing protein [Limnospira sp. PMC 917.15]
MSPKRQTNQTVRDSHVKCPECGAEFEVEAILRETIERELREAIIAETRQRLTTELRTKMQEEYEQNLSREQEKLQSQLQQALAKEHQEKQQLNAQLEELQQQQEAESKRIRQEAKAEARKELNEVRAKSETEKEQLLEELELRQERIHKLKDEAKRRREAERKLQDFQEELEEKLETAVREAQRETERQFRQTYQEKLNLELKRATADKDIKLAEKEENERQLRATIEQLQQQMEQKSQQLQGEAFECAIEKTLRQFYPHDYINEIKKGQHGADISQIVINSSGASCGKILYEAKRAQNWGQDWLNKLQQDGLAEKADVLVLVSTVLPKGANGFQQMGDNLFVCQYHELSIVAGLLRQTLIKVNAEKSLQDNRATVRDRLADYLISDEFLQSFRLIWEGYQSFMDVLAQEERSFKRQMAAKRKSLDRILEAQASITGTIEAIGRSPISDRILEQAQDFYLPED